MASPTDLFAKAERVEQLSAEIYRTLGDLFANQEKAFALFRALEMDELQHASRLKMLSSQFRRSRKSPLAGVDGARLLDGLIAEAEAALERVKVELPSLEEALLLCAALEERFATAHADLMAAASEPGLAAFYRSLAQQDDGHRKLLQEANKKAQPR